ncbi:unnamed protein product [Closterium sp. NIES-53]
MQTSQKQYANRQRRDHSVAVGDQVLLDTRNLNLSHLPSKLRPRFCGPFLVEAQVTPVTFRLRLPDTWKLHNAFHVQLLKPYKDPNHQFQGRQLPPPPPVLIQDEPEYEVERVLTHRRRGGKTLEFLLRWKGCDPTEDSWVVEADMGNARRALKDYLVKQGPVAAPCLCRLLSHKTLLWHHRLGHPSLPHLHGMHSRLLISGLPRSLPPLPPSPAPPCLPCVEGRQCAAPHSSLFPPTTAPLETLHMVVWGPDLPVLHLHYDRGGEFSSDLLRDFCGGEGILQSFTLPASPQKNGIAERRIGLVMEVARTSMIYAAASHFLWPFAVQYVVHQLILWPRVSLPETSPTLCWTGKVGDVSVFRVWGSRAFVRDTSADKLSSYAIPCVFFGFPPDAPGWQFYRPTSRRVLPSQDVTFDELVPFYRPPLVDPLPPQGPVPSGVSQVDPLPGIVPVKVAVDAGAARGVAFGGAASGGAAFGGVEPASVEPWDAKPEGVEPGGALSKGAEVRSLGVLGVGRTCLRSGAAGAGGSAAEGAGAGGARALSLGGAGVTAGAGCTGGAGAAGPGGACTRGTEAAEAGGVGGARGGDPGARGTGAGGAGTGGAGAGDPGAGGAGAGGTGAGGARAGGTGAGDTDAGGARAGGAGAGDPGAGGTRAGGAGVGGSGAGGTSVGDLGAGGAGAGGAGVGGAGAGGIGAGGTVQRRPFFVLPIPSSLPPPDSFALVIVFLVRVLLLSPALTLWHFTLPLFHYEFPCRLLLRPLFLPFLALSLTRAASPIVPRLLATVVANPSFESTAASALVDELVDFAAACRLDYATSLIAESESDCPPSIRGECALGTDILEDRQEDFEYFAAAVPHLVAMLLAPDIPTPRSYGEAITAP